MATTTAIALSATGTLVAAQAGYAIRVYAWALSFSGATNAKFQSHVTPTDLTGLIYGGTDTYAASPPLGNEQKRGQFQTLVGEALDLNLSGAVAVGGYVIWEYVGQS